MVVEHSVTEVVLFCVLIIVCLWCDLHAHQADKPVSARNAAIWSCIWVGLALVFAGYIGYSFGSEQVQLFLTGYLLEKSLSVDNLFVIMAVFQFFRGEGRVPAPGFCTMASSARWSCAADLRGGGQFPGGDVSAPTRWRVSASSCSGPRGRCGSPCTAARRKKSSTTPSTGPSGTPSASSPCTTSSAASDFFVKAPRYYRQADLEGHAACSCACLWWKCPT